VAAGCSEGASWVVELRLIVYGRWGLAELAVAILVQFVALEVLVPLPPRVCCLFGPVPSLGMADCSNGPPVASGSSSGPGRCVPPWCLVPRGVVLAWNLSVGLLRKPWGRPV
jgi:hypothetical protein